VPGRRRDFGALPERSAKGHGLTPAAAPDSRTYHRTGGIRHLFAAYELGEDKLVPSHNSYAGSELVFSVLVRSLFGIR
jgi:hypothetical protein